MSNCTHSEPYSFFCNQDTCWEARELSSKLIEKQMKQKKTTENITVHPNDSDNFSFCVQLVNTNNWKNRIDEMTKYGIVWQRIVKSWDELEDLLSQGKINDLNKKLSSFDVLNGELKTFIGPSESFVFNRYFVVGYQVVKPHLQFDEADISPCVVLDKYPITQIKFYSRSDGSSLGVKSTNYHFKPSNMGVESIKKKDCPLVDSIINAMDTHIRSNLNVWYTSTFDYCPHLISDSNLTDQLVMYFAQVFDSSGNEELGYCLISIGPNHPLDPKLKTDGDWMVDFEGYKWIVSFEPIKLNTLYLTDGLINACPDEVQYLQDNVGQKIDCQEQKCINTVM